MKNYQISHFGQIPSTNSYAVNLAASDKSLNNHVIWADQQIDGKGRANREWVSPLGNLYFSLIIRPQIKISELTKLSIICAVAIPKALDLDGLEFKWPNDILLGQKKFAGILIESENRGEDCDFVVIGIGINVKSYPDQVIFPATSLSESGIEISCERLLENFLDQFEQLFKNYQDYGFDNIKNYWLSKAYKLNQELTIKPGGKSFTGIFKGLNQEGNIIMIKDGEEFTFAVADIS